MIGPANPNLPTCHSCGAEHPADAMWLYRCELVCATCHADHEAKRHAEGCSDCGAVGGLEETAGGDLLCCECMESHNEKMAERAESAASESYYGGGCDAAVYQRNANRRI